MAQKAKTETKAVELVEPQSFITDAAEPLLDVCRQMIGYPQARKKVQQARHAVEKAMQLLDESYTELR